METRRLHLLLELSRLGSMRAVAEAHNLTTSTVSQQLAALTAETGTALIEPDGRRVRLTPAGQRLADHAVTILAAVDAARLDLDPDAEPVGTLRVGGFATAIRTAMLPVARSLQRSHPQVDVMIYEYEPVEAFALLERDDLDLALTYDYNLAPASPSPLLEAIPLWSTPWGLCVPDDAKAPDKSTESGIDSPRLRRHVMDSELTQHGRRARCANPRVAGRVHPSDHSPDRQSRLGRTLDPQ